MEPAWTAIFLTQRWLGPFVWAVLHSLDYYLTLFGARLYLRGANQVVDYAGSYELNPYFQSVIDRQRYFSRQFLVSLLGIAALLYVCATLLAYDPLAINFYGLLMGSIVFSRVAVITNHLSNIWLFRRILSHDSSVVGQIRYDRRTVYGMAVNRWMGHTVFLGAAFALAPNPWLGGGLLMVAVIALKLLLLGRRTSRAGPLTESQVPFDPPPSVDAALGEARET